MGHSNRDILARGRPFPKQSSTCQRVKKFFACFIETLFQERSLILAHGWPGLCHVQGGRPQEGMNCWKGPVREARETRRIVLHGKIPIEPALTSPWVNCCHIMCRLKAWFSNRPRVYLKPPQPCNDPLHY